MQLFFFCFFCKENTTHDLKQAEFPSIRWAEVLLLSFLPFRHKQRTAHLDRTWVAAVWNAQKPPAYKMEIISNVRQHSDSLWMPGELTL